jgi:hypothetical protein
MTIFIIIIFEVNPQSAPIVPNSTLQKILAALEGTIGIVLLGERAAEIVDTIWRQAPSDQLKE